MLAPAPARSPARGRSWLVHAAALFAVSCATARTVPAPATVQPDLALVSWNLHAGRGDLRALAADVRAGRFTNGTPPLDVVFFLQEARAGGIDRIARDLQLELFWAPVRTIDGVEQGDATLSSRPLADRQVIELPRERQRRLATRATIAVAGQPLLVVNAHLENRASWWKGGLPGDRARARQMAALLTALPPDVPGVLAGDLNIWLGTRERAYRDALARFPMAPPERPFLTFAHRLALDHILLRLPDRWQARWQLPTSRYGSDHTPLVAVIQGGGPR